MASSLKLTDGESNFDIGGSKNIQIQPYNTLGTPPLSSFSVYNNHFSFSAAENPSSDKQSLKIVLPLATTAISLVGNLPFSGMNVQTSYQFIGYSDRGNIDTGDFNIPFPT
jgi:hypothetical protein